VRLKVIAKEAAATAIAASGEREQCQTGRMGSKL